MHTHTLRAAVLGAFLWAVALAAAASAQAPPDADAPKPAAAPADKATPADEIAAAYDEFGNDKDAAEDILAAAIEARIEKLKRDTTKGIDTQSKEISRYQDMLAAFKQRGELPADEFRDEVRRYNKALVAAVRKCREAVKRIALRIRRSDADEAQIIMQHLDEVCPSRIEPETFITRARAVLQKVVNIRGGDRSLNQIRPTLTDLMRDADAGQLTPNQLHERIVAALEMIQGSVVYKEENRVNSKKLHAAAEALQAALEY